jgi:hypothetical protein
MQEDPWKDNSIKVECKIPKSAAGEYYCPDIKKILTKIIPDDPCFVPTYDPNYSCADLMANVSHGELTLAGNQSSIVDCGFSMEVSKGYRVRVQVHPDWLNKGLFVSTSSIDGQGRVKIFAINISNEPIRIIHKDKIAQIFIEPIYFFDWDYRR